MVIDPNVPYSICHPDLAKLVNYTDIAPIKPCSEPINWFLDRKLKSEHALTQAQSSVSYQNSKDIF